MSFRRQPAASAGNLTKKRESKIDDGIKINNMEIIPSRNRFEMRSRMKSVARIYIGQ